MIGAKLSLRFETKLSQPRNKSAQSHDETKPTSGGPTLFPFACSPQAPASARAEGAKEPGIDIEITESVIMDDVAGVIEKLKTIRDLGVSIAIDDFGTGYSSLGYLARLPVHSLKIDRSFIMTMVDNSDTMTLVSTVISLAHSLRLKVVAEGVETEDQAKVLRLLRCDEMQGYLVSRPVPVKELTALLASAMA
jgi:EAL domain-containing protein (putative c-di-GMP-specific phosphodiesterase class I)